MITYKLVVHLPFGGSLRPIMEDMRNGLTAEAADCWVLCPEPGDPDFNDAWVAATLTEDKRPKRPLEATILDAKTSAAAGEASTLQEIAVTAKYHTWNAKKNYI